MQDKANKILEIDQSSEGILRLLLNDAKNKNPLSDKMMMQLKKQLFKASNDNSIKVVIISAVGDVFCSGHNLKEITNARKNEDDGKSYFLMKKYDKSLMDIKATLTLEPRHFGALSGMGLIFMTRGDFQRALVAFTAVLKIYPFSISAAANMKIIEHELNLKVL